MPRPGEAALQAVSSLWVCSGLESAGRGHSQVRESGLTRSLAGQPRRPSEAWPRGPGDSQALGKRWDGGGSLTVQGSGALEVQLPLGSAVPVVWVGSPQGPAWLGE